MNEAAKEKRSAALYSILAAVGLITAKTTVGLMTGSLAILTDAAHSLLDMGASIITYFSVRISDKPADIDHHYGHGKVESLGALLQIIFLLGACVWIVFEAIHRLLAPTMALKLNIWAFAVVIGSIIVDFSRVRVLRRVAKKYSSQALAADALHFSSDIYVSSVVLFGLAAVQFGFTKADPIAAIVVSLFIVVIAARLGKQAIDVLLDRAPSQAAEIIRETVGSFPEILGIDQIRLRSDGRMTFAEMSLSVDRMLTFGRADELGVRLRQELHHRLPQTDVIFTMIPTSAESEQVADAVNFVASSFGLAVHHLIIRHDEDGVFISMHIEMPGEISLDEAHRKASEVSKKLHAAIPGLKKAAIHTEPYKTGPSAPRHMYDMTGISIRVKEIVESVSGVADCHNIVLTSQVNGLALSADMRMDGHLPLERTHGLSEDVEQRLRISIPELVSITLHLEPLK